MSIPGGAQSPPLQGRENDPIGQSAPGKQTKDAIPDKEQRGSVTGGSGEGAESGQAGGASDLSGAIDASKYAAKNVEDKNSASDKQ